MIQLCIQIHPFFSRFFSHIDYHRILGGIPGAIWQVPIGQSLHIPQSAYASPKPPTIPPQPIPYGNHKFVFKVYESVSFLQINPFVPFFWISHISDNTWYLCLSIIICRSIHDAANSIISFFLRLSNVLLYIYTLCIHIQCTHTHIHTPLFLLLLMDI